MIALVLVGIMFILVNFYSTIVNYLFEVSKDMRLIGIVYADEGDWEMGHRVGKKFYIPLDYIELLHYDGKVHLGEQLEKFRDWYSENVAKGKGSPKLLHLHFKDSETENLAFIKIAETDYCFSVNSANIKSLRISDRLIEELTGKPKFT